MTADLKRTKECMVCYLDILGGTKLIQEDDNDTSLNKVAELYNFALDQCRYRHLQDKERKSKIFSDNIVISQELSPNNDNIPLMHRFIELIRSLQWVFLGSKKLLRGAITIGQLYIDDVFVWGKALLAAYKIESSIAVYPRVIIDNSLLKRLPQKCIAQLYFDTDQLPFVDYFQLKGDDGGRFPILLQQYRNTLLQLWRDSDDSKIQQKILWLISYYNQKCRIDWREDFAIPIKPYQYDNPIDIAGEMDKPAYVKLQYANVPENKDQ